jgi:hypothetical protein
MEKRVISSKRTTQLQDAYLSIDYHSFLPY